jgi:hypothetical protein
LRNELEYTYPHSNTKDIERNVGSALLDVGVDEDKLSCKQKYRLFFTALSKVEKALGK